VDLSPGSCDAGSKRGLSSIDLEKWNRGDGCKLCPCVIVTVLELSCPRKSSVNKLLL
jgi:hypothetical protein